MKTRLVTSAMLMAMASVGAQAQDDAAAGIVIDHQHALACQLRMQAFVQRGQCVCPLQPGVEAERAALTQLAFDMDVATHHANQTAADGQAQARSTKTTCGAGVGLCEDVKDQALLVEWNANAGVSDLEVQPDVLVIGRRGHAGHREHDFALGCEFDGIAQ